MDLFYWFLFYLFFAGFFSASVSIWHRVLENSPRLNMRNSIIPKWAKNNKLASGKKEKWIHAPETLLQGHVVYLVKVSKDERNEKAVMTLHESFHSIAFASSPILTQARTHARDHNEKSHSLIATGYLFSCFVRRGDCNHGMGGEKVLMQKKRCLMQWRWNVL